MQENNMKTETNSNVNKTFILIKDMFYFKKV